MANSALTSYYLSNTTTRRLDPKINDNSFRFSSALYFLTIKLANWITLSNVELNAVSELKPTPIRRLTNNHIPNNSLLIVSSGIAYAARFTRSGGRHISRVYYPGDIINFEALFASIPSYEIYAKNAKFEQIEFDSFRNLLNSLPAIEWILMRYESARTHFLTDRFCSAIRCRALVRLLQLLLELKAQDELVYFSKDDKFTIDLTQQELGDMTGLTPVYISKTFSQLKRFNFIDRQRSKIHFLDRSAAERECGFVNYYATDQFSFTEKRKKHHGAYDISAPQE